MLCKATHFAGCIFSNTSCTEVTGIWWLLSHAQNAVRWLALYKRHSSKASSLCAAAWKALSLCSWLNSTWNVFTENIFTISGCIMQQNLCTLSLFTLLRNWTGAWGQGYIYMGIIHAKPWTCVVGRTTDKTSYLSFHWLPITLRYCQAIPKYFSKL